MRSDAYWLRLEESYHRDPIQANFGAAYTLENPAGFRAYMTMSRYDPRHSIHKVVDLYGRERWLNDNGWRILALALLHIASDTQTTLTVMSQKLGVHRQTVSRWITKLTAWGMIGSGTVRGRYGGIVLFARKVTDNLERYAQKAREKLTRSRSRSKCAPSTAGRRQTAYFSSPSLLDKGAHLDLAERLGLDKSRSSGQIACPAHEDKRASLSWKIGEGGKLLVHCFAGCTFDEIRAAS